MARITEIRLNDTKAVCRLLGRVIRGMLAEKESEGYIDTNTGRAVVYASATLLSALNQSDIEVRLQELEAAVLDRKWKQDGVWSV